MIMPGSVPQNETDLGGLMKPPDEVAGGQTQSTYIVLRDADAAYTRAKAGGVKIAIEIRDEDHGGRRKD